MLPYGTGICYKSPFFMGHHHRQIACILSMLAGLLASAALWAAPDPNDTIEGEYQSARQCYYDIANSPAQQQQREHWEECARRFLHLESTYPRSQRAEDALFTTAKLYEQLFQASKNRDDLQQAVRYYGEFAKRHEKSRLADDALFRAGVVYWNGFHDKKQAATAMHKLLKWYPKGDLAEAATQFLTQLETMKQFQPIGTLSVITPAPNAVAARGTTPVAPPPAVAPAPLPSTTAKPAAPITAPPPPLADPTQCRIAIDPGHGGTDPGTIGRTGSLEKAVTLSIAKRVARMLRTQLGCDVQLTRSRDQFVSLDERNVIANRQKADLFISIHANAAQSPEAHGVQTYYLNNASDQAAQRLASRENTMAGKSLSEVEHIVNTMLQNAFTEDSRRLAGAVHTALIKRLQKKYADVQDQKVRSALFYVLVGAKSPSILVETSYLSNPREEARLLSPDYQEAIAAGIADGVTQFLHPHATSAVTL